MTPLVTDPLSAGLASPAGASGLVTSALPALRTDLLLPLLIVGLLVAALVLIWPPRRRGAAAATALGGTGFGGRDGRSLLGDGGGGGGGEQAGGLAESSVWRQDPVVLYRTWRLRHDPDVLLQGVLELLDAMSPALALGLTPARALSLAIAATTRTAGPEPVGSTEAGGGGDGALLLAGHRRDGRADPQLPESRTARQGPRRRGRAPGTDVDRLVGSLTAAAHRGVGLADVWAQWARLTRSPDLAFVASAWALSEHHGAPLAVAVDRAAAGLREARARRRRVAVAVAGPKATVTVLTLLPLAGPAFGAACGIDPATLYLGSPLAATGALVGLALIIVGRLWCQAMIRRAVAA